MTGAEESTDLIDQIAPMLAGRSPSVIGCTLCWLWAMLIAGHHPDLREKLIALHIKMMREAIPIVEKDIFPNGLPDVWPDAQ